MKRSLCRAVVWSIVFLQIISAWTISALMFLLVPESVLYIFGDHNLPPIVYEYLRSKAAVSLGFAYLTLRTLAVERETLEIVLEALIVVDSIELAALFFGMARLINRISYFILLAYVLVSMIFHSTALFLERRNRCKEDIETVDDTDADDIETFDDTDDDDISVA